MKFVFQTKMLIYKWNCLVIWTLFFLQSNKREKNRVIVKCLNVIVCGLQKKCVCVCKRVCASGCMSVRVRVCVCGWMW